MTPPPIDAATVEELKRLNEGIEGLDYGHHAVEVRRLMYRQRAALIAAAEENVRLRERVEELEKYAKAIVGNCDHRRDSHRYDTWCYVCEAEKLLAPVTPPEIIGRSEGAG